MLQTRHTYQDSRLIERRVPDVAAGVWHVFDGAGKVLEDEPFTDAEVAAALDEAAAPVMLAAVLDVLREDAALSTATREALAALAARA